MGPMIAVSPHIFQRASGSSSGTATASIWTSTRRGDVDLAARQDDAIPDGVVFIPSAFAEAAANLLTNAALDPFGKIPEFKFCAARVEPVGALSEAAE